MVVQVIPFGDVELAIFGEGMVRVPRCRCRARGVVGVAEAC